MKIKTPFHVGILFLIFLNLSIVCADSNDNLTVVEPSFDEFNNVDVIFKENVTENNEFEVGTVDDSFFMVRLIKLKVRLIK